jgi:hypothetical protein
MADFRKSEAEEVAATQQALDYRQNPYYQTYLREQAAEAAKRAEDIASGKLVVLTQAERERQALQAAREARARKTAALTV